MQILTACSIFSARLTPNPHHNLTSVHDKIKSKGVFRSDPHQIGSPAITSNYPQSSSPLATTIKMDNETIKKSIMQQILQEANSANARTLMEVC